MEQIYQAQNANLKNANLSEGKIVQKEILGNYAEGGGQNSAPTSQCPLKKPSV